MKTRIERKGRIVMLYHWINNVWKLVKVTCMLVVLLGMSSCAYASTINDHKAILTIIGEDENNFEGMKYVASTIRNRNTLRGAYGLHSPRVVNHLYSEHSLKMATLAWQWSDNHNLHCSNWFSDEDLKLTRVQYIIRKDHLIFVKRVGSKRYGNSFYRRSHPISA